MMALPARLRSTLRVNVSLKAFNAWRVGGAAAYLYQPFDAADLKLFLSRVPAHLPLTWLGLGSNVLIRDKGLLGVVLVTHPGLGQLLQTGADRVRVEAGVPCAKLARFCAKRGLAGVEFMAGIPGTLGGALAMNAGAFGAETWNCVEQVETINRQGQVRLRSRDAFQIGYRHVGHADDGWFMAAHLRVAAGDSRQLQAAIKALLARRTATQPTGIPTCGSVFQNPASDFAGRLIEAAGLKGYAIGGARVSERHANFIENSGQASAADIEALIQHVRDEVASASGIYLQPEVRILGEWIG